MYYSVPSYYTEDLTCYTTEILKYCTTTYVSPANTTKAAEYYTTKAAEYYTTKAASLLHYNLRCSRVLQHQRHPSFTSLLSLLPHTTPKLRKHFSVPSYYTTYAAEYDTPY
jgi:hypothetical protein